MRRYTYELWVMLEIKKQLCLTIGDWLNIGWTIFMYMYIFAVGKY